MSKKICVASVMSVGGTFVDWSIQFLSGKTKYYHIDSDKYVDLSCDPITKLNAHGHDKNHPNTSAKLIHEFNTFDLLPNDPEAIYSTYMFIMNLDVAADNLGVTHDLLDQPQQFQTVMTHALDDFNKTFKICNDTQTKLVYISADIRIMPYHNSVRSLDRFVFSAKKPQCDLELHAEIQEYFFNSSVSTWNHMGLTDIWDVRERMALDSRPLQNDAVTRDFDFQYPHLWINGQELFADPERTIKKIFSYLESDINPVRYQQWLNVCKKWQRLQLDLLNFCYTLPHIIKATVNGWDYKINLTFQQEVIVQHYLIYQHNLNLKTWHLEKYPDNTQQLHKLLEPNIHPVQDIYNSRSTT